jgi:hypothetical protein
MSGPPDEFEWIERLRPLTRGDARALDLRDDAAALPARPGFDLIISKDTLVEGVHLLPGEDAEIMARRLLRTSLSDLAAKAAEPFGYFLSTAWPPTRGWPDREAFIRGLALDGEAFCVPDGQRHGAGLGAGGTGGPAIGGKGRRFADGLRCDRRWLAGAEGGARRDRR